MKAIKKVNLTIILVSFLVVSLGFTAYYYYENSKKQIEITAFNRIKKELNIDDTIKKVEENKKIINNEEGINKVKNREDELVKLTKEKENIIKETEKLQEENKVFIEENKEKITMADELNEYEEEIQYYQEEIINKAAYNQANSEKYGLYDN